MSGSTGSLGWPHVFISIVIGGIVLVALKKGVPIQIEAGKDGLKVITSSVLSPSSSVISPVETPTSSPLIQQPPIPTSSPTLANTYKEKYKKGEYPMSDCGKVSGLPVYPVFISRGSSSFERSKNFERVTKEFCQDATDVNGRIRVASFTDEKEADMFVEFLKEHFDEAWKGGAQ